MIILLDPAVGDDALREIASRLESLGLRGRLLQGVKGRALEVQGAEPGRALALRGAPGVREVLSRRTALVGGEPLWPHVALRVAMLSLALLLGLLALVVVAPPGLGDAAHPDGPSAGGGSEWFLRPAERLLELAGPQGRVAGGVLLAAAWLALLLWPFLERLDGATTGGRTLLRLLRVAGVLAALAWVVLAAGGAP